MCLDVDQDLFVVIVSDGLTCKLSDQEMVDFIIENLNDPKVCDKLIQKAGDLGSLDDKTVVLCRFGWNDEVKEFEVEEEKEGETEEPPEKKRKIWGLVMSSSKDGA